MAKKAFYAVRIFLLDGCYVHLFLSLFFDSGCWTRPMVETELVRKKATCERKRTYRNLNNNYCTATGVVIRVRSSGFLTKFCSNFSSTQVKQSHHCRHIFSGLQHLRPPCRRDSFDNFDKTLMKTRNNGLKCQD